MCIKATNAKTKTTRKQTKTQLLTTMILIEDTSGTHVG